MKTRLGIIAILSILVVILGINLFLHGGTTTVQVTNFAECVAEGNAVMESYPPQCRAQNGQVFVEDIDSDVPTTAKAVEPTLTVSSAQAIASASALCTNEGAIGTFEVYNPSSGTWWFSLEAEKQGCSPACVVSELTKQAEVNWRCTGLR